ncbi:MAG TPA: peptidoglycan-binding domain-containing protein [Alphaproteobacteria bacterium]|nr:peptidoglycan-binding domain-containing protein [Alphaproteobacteria bacterium]
MSKSTMSKSSMSKSGFRILPAALLSLAVAACGSNPKERGLSGGAIGAGTGAVVGAVTGMSVLTGVAIGTGVGAVVGAVTTPNQINLGSLHSGSGHKAAAAGKSPVNAMPASYNQGSPLVEDVQVALGQAGYNPGPADGVIGPRTRAAISDYQRANGMTADGMPSSSLLEHLRSRNS